MKQLSRRPKLPRRGLKSSLLDKFLMPGKGIFGVILILIFLLLLIPAYPVQAETPTLAQAGPVKVIVHLIDSGNHPLVGLTVNLVLNRYGDAIEEIQAGSCVTDGAGSCVITVADPPRLRSGRIEGFIDLGEYGRQLIGWNGESYEITIILSPDGKLATVPAPLDGPYEGQTEQPTDAPLSTLIRTLLATATLVPTATAFLITATPTPSTAPATITIVPQAIIPTPVISSTPIPASHPSQRSGWVWIGLGLVLFASLGAAFAILYHRQRKTTQSG